MNTALANNLWRYPSAYITEDQLAQYLGGSADSRYARIRRAVQDGYLIRLKRGLYQLGERFSPKTSHPFEAAQLIYGPSYISLESALSYHGLIPEAVRVITSTTMKRQNAFKTPFGLFAYHTLPVNNFFIGVNYVKENNYTFLLASPWKALLDYIYCYKKKWTGLEPLAESLRIDLDDLPKISSTDLEQLKNFYQRENINHFIKHLPKEYIDEH